MVQSTTRTEAPAAGALATVARLPARALGPIRRSVLPAARTPPSDSNPRPAAHATSRLRTLIPSVLAGLAFLLVAVAIGLFLFRTLYHDRIYPAIAVGDVSVGGLTPAEAEIRLTERAAALEQGTIAFSHSGQTWAPTLAELGATVDLDTSIAAAHGLGREGDASDRFAFTGDLLQADQVVPLQTRLDTGVLNAWFDRVDRDINQPARDATIVVEGTHVSVTPDAPGIEVDREAATQTILAALASLQPVSGDLPTAVAEPAIRAADLGPAQATVAEALAAPVRVAFEDQAWRIDPETLSGYLAVETVLEQDGPTARLTMDTERLAADLRREFTDQVNREPTDARVAWSDEEGLIALDPSETGVSLEAGPFAEAVAGSFLNGHPKVDVPVVITRPEIDDGNLDALGIATRLGRGDSYYGGGSWQRDENIDVGVNLLNGTLVRPGETFSFNEAIGEITASKGYVEASVVVAERVGKDIGGGICQVSTTMFRAALLAGMPITEWHPHTYRIRNYEEEGWGPGFDASILQYGSTPDEWADFKFENYTDGWLLVEAWATWPNVIVNIYGTDTGRTVEIVEQWQSEPIVDNEDIEVPTAALPAGERRQTEWPMAGLEAGFTRVMYDGSGNEVARREFYTNFKGRGNVYEVGTG